MKILLAIDGSKYSRWAIDLLLALPLAKSPDVTVMHVVESGPVVHALIAPSEKPEYNRTLQKHMDRNLAKGQELVARSVDRLSARWKKVRAVLEEGLVADTIIKRAQRNKVDLIILGSRGLGQVSTFLMGGVSQKVITYAPCSVLVVKKKARGIREVLLALDGSKYADGAAVFLGSHFLRKKIRSTVLYAWEYPYRLPESAVTIIKERCVQVMKTAGLEAKFQFVSGQVAKRIVEIATQGKTDLVVVGSRGLTGLKRFLLGGISQKVVLHSPASVLVVRRR
jgi:nucleotide-binding universal stress UspA family protein